MEKLDVELYLEARKHYDYIWFEMQHATLTYAEGKTRLSLCAFFRSLKEAASLQSRR